MADVSGATPPTMRALLPLLGLVALTGCTGLRQTLDPSEADGLAVANRRFAERPATVVLATGERAPAQALRVAPDTTTWVDPETGALRTVATADVVEVRRSDPARARRRFVRQQVVVGAVLGALGGAVVGDLFARGFPFGDADASVGRRAAGVAVGGTVGSGMGAVQGAVVGAIYSPTASTLDRYVLVPPRPPAPAADTTRGGVGR